jgi:RIO-like serine/threonine protein kinase
MASGILGQIVGTGSEADVYTVPSSTLAVVNISIVNNDSSNSESIVLRLVDSGDTSAAKHNIENFSLPRSAVVERTAIVMGAGDKLTLNASSDVSISVWGIEESV